MKEKLSTAEAEAKARADAARARIKLEASLFWFHHKRDQQKDFD